MQQLRLSDILPFPQELSTAEKLLLGVAEVAEAEEEEEVVLALVVAGEVAERSTRMPWCNLFCCVIFNIMMFVVGYGTGIEYRFVVYEIGFTLSKEVVISDSRFYLFALVYPALRRLPAGTINSHGVTDYCS
jgi:hypothetical protein